MRLLIVEDNEELAELLAKGLQSAGYETDVLSTVEEATSVLLTTFYAALILDLGLPGAKAADAAALWGPREHLPIRRPRPSRRRLPGASQRHPRPRHSPLRRHGEQPCLEPASPRPG